MKNYKEHLQIRTNILSVAIIVVAAAFFTLNFYRNQLPELPSFIKGFHQGAFIGFSLYTVYLIGKHWRVRKDEKALKEMYINENDERTALIFRNAGLLGLPITLSGLCIASIVAGFFSIAVFFALMSALVFILAVHVVLWEYYSKKL